MSDHLDDRDRELLAYYHLGSCDWVANERRPCSCGLLDRVASIVRYAARLARSDA